MSLAHIEQFSRRVRSDPAMFNQLIAGTQTWDEFVDKAIALGKEKGFDFSREEADAWIKTQTEAKATGELSDLQLEDVAGGSRESREQEFMLLMQGWRPGNLEDRFRLEAMLGRWEHEAQIESSLLMGARAEVDRMIQKI